MNSLRLKLTKADYERLDTALDSYTMLQVIPRSPGETWIKVYGNDGLPLILKFTDESC